jgi:hypothetical protein
MPLTTSPIDPEHPRPEAEAEAGSHETAAARDRNAPVSFVPHEPPGGPPSEAVRIRTGRYGELDEHELIHLLDSIEDERARGRFRESIYISCFIWIAIAWVVLYGPRYLWHAPKLVTPFDVLKQRELTQLNMPALHPHIAPRPAPKVDTRTLEHLRTEQPPAPKAPPPAPAETAKSAPTPAPSVTTTAPPVASPAMPLPSAPQPTRRPPPVVAEAPTPQPNAKPSFNTNNSPEGVIDDARRYASRHPGGGSERSGGGGPLNFGGVDILSDTQGVDFDPYIRRLLADIYRNWLPLIPEEAKPPLSAKGEALIRFSLGPDGRIIGMHLDGSTNDDAINRSCWGSITSEGQFPPLPSQFHGPKLELRIHYYVNKQTEQ